MKRSCLLSCLVTAAVALPATARADLPDAPVPCVFFVPNEGIDLRPADGTMGCSNDVDHSALGCAVAVDAETTTTPYDDVDGLVASLADALAAYDIVLTTTRPPDYVSYHMLFPSADENLDSASFACTTARISCGSAKRNGITFTFGGTENCTFGDDPAASVVHAALYSMGRMLGLEGLVPDTYQDAMEYPPDLVAGLDLAGSPAYDDACHDIENQIGFNDQGEPTEQQIECTSLDHVTCDAADQQNSHQDLLAICGAAPAEADTAAPELTNVVPEDGTVHPADEPFVMDVDIADNDPTVGVRWTIQSDALMSDDFPEGAITKCTNDICTLNWDEVFKPTDSDWVFNELSPPNSGWPSGEYVITVEAADLHGNVAETITVTVTVENEGPGTGGSGDGGTGSGSDGGVDDSGFGEESGSGDAGDGSGESGSGSASGGENDEGGCGCTQGSDAGGAALMLFGLAGLGFARRRRRQ